MTAQRIIQHIFQQPALSRLSTAELEELVTAYPYFTAARLLLAQKNYEQYPSLHTPAVKKAQLYSNNPHYFYQLVTGELEKAVEAPALQVESQSFNSYHEPLIESAPAAEREPEQEFSFLLQERDEIPTAQEEPEEPAFAASFTEEAAATVTIDEQEPQVEASAPAEEIVTEHHTAPAEDPANAVTEEEATPSLPDAAFIFGEETPAETSATEEPAAETAEPEPVEEPAAVEEPIKIFPLEIPREETTLTFQPLYTDDYFAYKRLKEPDHAEELNEKGMAEMRSFTDWLREMKHSFAKKADKDWYHQQLHRLYVDDEPEVSEAVEKMAMESITLNDDIVSETLAEIWARQRQYQTAIQIYQKLSLLNPNKSAYFAQKIQELQSQQSETGKN